MRRFLVTLLIVLVPVQFAWSAMNSMHGHHIGDRPATLGFHTHAGDHGSGAEPALNGEHGVGHDADSDGDNGLAGGHYHTTVVSLLIRADLALDDTCRCASPPHSPASFTSRIPPLFDWPPSARG
jgi:hypothetical protein